jgi:hypothetical protein
VGDSEWSKRLSDGLARLVGETDAQKIMDGAEKLEALDENGKAAWVIRAMDKLDARVSDEEAKFEIMTECSCRCYEPHLDELKNLYHITDDIDRLLEAMHGKVFLLPPVRQGNMVYITKAPHFPEQYQQATTAEERKYYFCHCDYARAASEEISPTYCYCGAGWCRRIWEAVLGRPVRVDITKSVLQGDDVCQFAVHL